MTYFEFIGHVVKDEAKFAESRTVFPQSDIPPPCVRLRREEEEEEEEGHLSAKVPF